MDKIRVKQEHIDAGKRRKGTSCPIALAIQEAVGDGVRVRVYYSFLEVDEMQFYLPTVAQSFVHEFDRNGKREVKPFSFEI